MNIKKTSKREEEEDPPRGQPYSLANHSSGGVASVARVGSCAMMTMSLSELIN
jgi:hypothetical protein